MTNITTGARRVETFAGMFLHQATSTISPIYLTLNRAYDPFSGRWLSRDPVGAAGGINLYAYVDGDPINFVDPFGLDLTSPGGPNTPPAPTPGGNGSPCAGNPPPPPPLQLAQGTKEPPCDGPLSDCAIGNPLVPKLRPRGTIPTPFGNLCPDCAAKNYPTAD